MIHTTENFYNKVVTAVTERYFKNNLIEDYKNEKYHAAKYAIELFSNGCINYRLFINRLSKACGTNNATIHNLAERHIVSFGQYQYKPGKLYSEAKATI